VFCVEFESSHFSHFPTLKNNSEIGWVLDNCRAIDSYFWGFVGAGPIWGPKVGMYESTLFEDQSYKIKRAIVSYARAGDSATLRLG
jgi:hypothetical protein